ETDHRTRLVRLADDFEVKLRHTALVLLMMDLPIEMDVHFECLTQCVYDGGTHTVQAAGNLVAAAAEFTAGMKHCQDDFDRRTTHLLLYVHRDAAAVVSHLYPVVLFDRYIHTRGVPGHCLVDAVIDDFPHQVVEPLRCCGSDIHTRTLSD